MMSDTVLVTGANSGIGLAAVIERARREFNAVGSVRSEEKARHVRAEAEKAGVTVDTVLLDVTDAVACERVVNDLRPFGLVNNADEEISDDEARRALETMLVAPVRMARLALAHMRTAGGGRIVGHRDGDDIAD